jgi:hypothetical protein
MNELLYIMAAFGFTIIVCGLWVLCSTLFRMWLINDWCRHEWGTWEDAKTPLKDGQTRYCKKCNKKEIYLP